MTTTASGLKYQDLKAGDGASPRMGQTVTVHYIGRLENGTEFNNSYNLRKPIDFKLGQVIEGWNEGFADHESRRQAQALDSEQTRLRSERQATLNPTQRQSRV